MTTNPARVRHPRGWPHTKVQGRGPTHPRTIVVGSVNKDTVATVDRFPEPGETVLSRGYASHAGGKGANQAVAAARLGAVVSLIACVGNDPEGDDLLAALDAEQVDTSEVEVVAGYQSGLASIFVTTAGENTIVVTPGANAALEGGRVGTALYRLSRPGDVVVVQAEIPTQTLRASITKADELGLRTVVNLAPFVSLEREYLALADPLVVNEIEARTLLSDLGMAPDDVAQLAVVARSVVVTAGGAGARWWEATGCGHVPAPAVERVVDTTGAGDALVGALSLVLASGGNLAEAVELGVRAGSYAVQQVGTHSSYPFSGDISAAGHRGAAPAAEAESDPSSDV